MNKKRLLSGIQPTGRMHLGNYLGAVSNWAKMQEDNDAFFMIADLHALTCVYENPAKLRTDKYNLALDLLAAGIDPEKSCLFNQSEVKEHSELHLALSMITPLSWLTRVPSYKSKKEEIKGKDLDTYGFLGYPVLQAADIMLYKAEVVPVGQDQLAHLELTREIARRFNHLYKNVFPEPAEKLTQIPILPGTDGRKMSKSYGNDIAISATAEETTKLVMKMLTDPNRQRRNDPGNPEVCPVYAYQKTFNISNRVTEIASQCKSGEIGCVDCKKECAKVVNDMLEGFRTKREEISAKPDYVQEVLNAGAKKAREIAAITMLEVRESVGL